MKHLMSSSAPLNMRQSVQGVMVGMEEGTVVMEEEVFLHMEEERKEIILEVQEVQVEEEAQ